MASFVFQLSVSLMPKQMFQVGL